MANNAKEQANADSYWKRNLSIIRNLMIVWVLVSFVASIILGPALNNITLGSLPLGFWFAQQGSIIVFVILIFVYCWIMDRVDKEFNVDE